MKPDLTIFYWAMPALAAMVLAVKHRYTANTQKTIRKRIMFNWLFLYSRLRIDGTSSRMYRKFMIRANAITIIVWLFIVLGLIAYFTNKMINR